MWHRDRRSATAAFVIALSAGAAAAQVGEITPLPSLGGAGSLAFGTNDAGEVVGEAELADGTVHAVRWVGGVPTDLGAIDGNSSAWAINNSGQIVGWSDAGASPRTAMLWEGGGWTDLGADMNAVGSSVGWDINDNGLVVGQASITGGFSKGFVWSGPGTGLAGGTVPGYNGGANKGVNGSGVVVGHGFFFGDPDTAMMGVPDGRGGYDAQEIGPSGYTFSIAHSINDAGTIIGLANLTNGPWSAAVFTLDRDNPVVLLGSLPGFENSEAYDINEAGVIVGSTLDDDFLMDPHAWVYFDGRMHDLNDFLAPDQSEWDVLVSAQSINAAGDIAGFGWNSRGELAGFVMTGVVPSPCDADLDGNGEVNTQDFLAFLNLWVAQESRADWNGDGSINTQDVLRFLNDWAACR